MRRKYLPDILCVIVMILFMTGAAVYMRAGQDAVAVGELEPEPVNINSAGLEELQILPGIGEVKAAAIIEYRNANGCFRDVDELLEVPGIGEATLEGFRDYICADIPEGAQ